MSKKSKTNRYLEGKILGMTSAEASAAKARVADLELELARLKAAPVAPVAPVAAPAAPPSLRAQMKAIVNPVDRAVFALEHRRAILEEKP